MTWDAAQCSDGRVSDAEDVLDSGRPPLPRRVRAAAWVAVAVAAGTLVGLREWPRSAPKHHPVAASSSAAQRVPPPVVLRSWPSAPEACGGYADLPLVSSGPVTQPTGLGLLVGGPTLSEVDFDSGRAVRLPKVLLRHDEYIAGLVTAAQTYALTDTCTASGQAVSRMVRVDAAGQATDVRLPSGAGTVFADGSRAWSVTYPDEHHQNASLVLVAGGDSVLLPAGVWPDSMTAGVVMGSTSSGHVVLADAATGHLRADLGTGLPLAAGSGLVTWTDGCDLSTIAPCTVHRRSVAGGPVASYRVPRPPGGSAGVISSDRRLLAFTLERAVQDPRYDQGHPIPPADVAILHLDTGGLTVIPGIELPAKMAASLAFSPDGRWLVMALNAGTRTRLLAWREGLSRAVETQPLAGLVFGPPAFVVQSRPGA